METTLKSLKAIVLFVFVSMAANAQQLYKNIEAANIVKGSNKVIVNKESNRVSYAAPEDQAPVSGENAVTWLTQNVLHCAAPDNFQLIRTEKDELGFEHARYQQYYNNVKVDKGVYYIHTSAGKLKSVNGHYYPDIKVNTVPSITKTEAFQRAIGSINATTYKWTNRPDVYNQFVNNAELVVSTYKNQYRLAYKCDVFASAPLSRNYVYVDAQTGEVFFKLNRIEEGNSNGTAVTLYSGTQKIKTDSLGKTSFQLTETTRGSGISTLNMQNGTDYTSAVNFTNTSNYWNTTTNQDDAAYDAHWGAEKWYDYYKTSFNRNSFDNLGAQVLVYVHYDYQYDNAFWDGTEINFGDGDGFQYGPFTSLDIVGHELTHAVTQYTAGLDDSYGEESGALNEGNSDIFGATINFTYNSANASWQLGKAISPTGTPIRDIQNPKNSDNPDTYLGINWDPNGEPHQNSTVLSHWYYLLCEGGSGTNDNGDSYSINAIGMSEAAAIQYRALTVYMTPETNYYDAANYTIQAATDLYGDCSNEVIQVTNAWYAVGVRSLFSNAVEAAFSASSTYACVTPASITFTNKSFNATTYNWKFGDGGTSTATNPTHSYTSTGTYSVTLIAHGSATCGNNDTLVRTNYITVTNAGAPTAPSCSPATQNYCCGYGITNVQLGGINNTTLNNDGYKDYTCTEQTTLVAGNSYEIQIATNPTLAEDVSVWIDYSNNGQFNNTNELALVSDSITGVHTGVIHIPSTAPVGVPIRMRVTSDASGFGITGGCYSPYYGQVEDYALFFTKGATQAPVANFIADDTLVNTGQTVHLSDLSTNAPTSWAWTLTGGVPTSSTNQDATVSYATPGYYTVTLKATNASGSNTVTKTAYIHVVNSFNMCSASSSTAAVGTLYDSGGPNGNYGYDENCTFLIAPPCASTVTVHFASFNTEDGADYLYIYDDTGFAANMLTYASGSYYGGDVTSYTGRMYIYWSSDYENNYSGYQLNWTSAMISSPQITAGFTKSVSNSPLNTPVQFTDQSSPGPIISWLWNFGDGSSSALQNPAHSYSSPGNYKVTLTVYNCSTHDSASQTITVQQAPVITISPKSFNVSPSCNDSIPLSVIVTNTGNGTGVVSANKTSAKSTLQVLVSMNGVDQYGEYVNTINALNTYYTAYQLTSINTMVPSALQTALIGKDVLFLPTTGENGTSELSTFSTVIQGFINGGGNVVILGQEPGEVPIDAGIFTGSYYSTDYGGSVLNVLQSSSPLLTGVASPFYDDDLTTALTITNSDATHLITYGSGDVVTARQTTSGAKIVYIGYDFYESNATDFDKVLGNAFQWIKDGINSLPINMSATPSQLQVPTSSSDTLVLSVSSKGLSPGANKIPVILYTNDPLHPQDTVTVTVNVSSIPCVNFTYSQIGCDYTISFTSNATNSPTSYRWNFGDGSSSTIADPEYTYANSGTYNVSLIVSNTHGSDTIKNQVVVSAGNCLEMCSVTSTTKPSGYFYDSGGPNGDYSPNESCTLLIQPACATSITLHFNYLDVDDYEDFMYVYDGTNASGIFLGSFTGDYAYDVTATSGSMYIVWNSDSYAYGYEGWEAIWSTVQLSGTPVKASFTASTTFPNVGQIVDFTNTTTGQATSLQWFFGDGSQSSSLNPTHAYALQGVYSAILVTTNCTYSDTATQVIVVGKSASVVVNPTSFSISNSCTSDTSVETVQIFNYGQDTAKVNVQFEGAQPAWAQITSPANLVIKPGAYALTDIQFNASGLGLGTYKDSITVFSNDPGHPVIHVPLSFDVNGKPCADFTYLTDTCTGIVHFYDNSRNNPTQWLWHFGDGNTSSLASTAHQYTQNNHYTVQLTAINSYGSNDIAQPVSIENIIAGKIVTVGNNEKGQPLSFSSTVPNATSWQWNFGDNDTSSLQFPVHTFKNDSVYFVSVFVHNTDGCSGEILDTLSITATAVPTVAGGVTGATIYPNPTSGISTLYFELANAGNVSIGVYDVEGRLVQNILDNRFKPQGHQQCQINTSMTSGVYYVRLKTSDTIVTLPLVKVE